ncbi:hypothetical protein ACO0K7_09105 [Undibacterium sp. Ji67W]|uniref:hypothetical protein n=1 Tax=Undibacterium sp. Ji67W TaxID=3413042 RepID=UPI003BF14C53
MIKLHIYALSVLIGFISRFALACDVNAPPDNIPLNTDPNIRGVAVYLPLILERSDQGPFVDLIKIINKYYPEGKISITIEPVKRIYSDINNRRADFGMPTMKLNDSQEANLPTQFAHEALGKVTFVVYSHKKNIVNKSDLSNPQKVSNLNIEAPPVDWGFPIHAVIDLEQSMKKLNAGHLDAVIWAQEEADYEINKLHLNNIHRAFYNEYPDMFFMPCSKRGDFVNQVLSKAIKAAALSGELQIAHDKVHQPYIDWQP